MEDQHHILVVDDDHKITRMLERTLTSEGYRVTISHDGPGALRRAGEVQPDIVILDVMLPGMDGVEVCRRLRASSQIPVLMLTARDEIEDRVQGLDSGADDYLVKPFATAELLARLRALLRRPAPTDEAPEILQYADLTLDMAARQARRSGRLIELSTTEYELLTLLMRRADQVVTRAQIMERVWGYDFEGESNVLEVYVRYLRTKLEAEGSSRLLHTVRGVGYVLREQQ